MSGKLTDGGAVAFACIGVSETTVTVPLASLPPGFRDYFLQHCRPEDPPEADEPVIVEG